MSFVRVPKGRFMMGSQEEDELAWGDEKPQHEIDLPYEYWVARFPVSVADFRAFVRATAYVSRAEQEGWAWVWHAENQWEKVQGADWAHPLGERSGRETLAQGPVVQVCWYDARAYCEWLNQNHGHELPEACRFRLPSEAEWEKAARGPQGKQWPWGDAFDPDLCNSRESGRFHTVAIGSYAPRGDSEYGAADMSGNVWEWTITLWGNDRNQPAFVYPYRGQDGRENTSAGEDTFRIIRGGSFKDDMQGVRCACRDLDPPHYALSNLGFRVFVTPKLALRTISSDAPGDQTTSGSILGK